MREFIIQLDNRPGELARVARALGQRGIDIQRVSCIGAGPLSGAIVTVSDEAATRDVLHGLGHPYLEGESLVVDVEDRPGGLADVAERFGAAGVNIVGVLCVGRRPGIVEMAFAVDDIGKARDTIAAMRPAARVAAPVG
jgi:hypothetical protein